MSNGPQDGGPTETAAGGPESEPATRGNRRSDGCPRLPAAGRSATPVGPDHAYRLGHFGEKNETAKKGGDATLTKIASLSKLLD